MEQKQTVTDRVIAGAGSAAKLARAIGVTPQAVFLWKRNDRIPVERVLACEKISGVTRSEMRPDIYPAE